MSAPTDASAIAPLRTLSFLTAPLGQLSEDGQLRELIEERRRHKGEDAELWYLGPELVEELRLRQAFRHPPGEGHDQLGPDERIEAVVAGEAAVITWLQLRFGGCARTITIPVSWLQELAKGVPPRPRRR